MYTFPRMNGCIAFQWNSQSPPPPPPTIQLYVSFRRTAKLENAFLISPLDSKHSEMTSHTLKSPRMTKADGAWENSLLLPLVLGHMYADELIRDGSPPSSSEEVSWWITDTSSRSGGENLAPGIPGREHRGDLFSWWRELEGRSRRANNEGARGHLQ